MSDSLGIIESWECAEYAKKKRNYAIAARFYRICHISYNNGELGEYNFEVEFFGIDSLRRFKKMLRKVSQDEKEEILNEELNLLKESSYSNLFLSNDWRKFILEQHLIITQKYQEILNQHENRIRNPFVNLHHKIKNWLYGKHRKLS